MNRNTALVIVFVLAVFIIIRLSIVFDYMNQNEKQGMPGDYPAELPVLYSGLLPCADCPGISYYLEVKEDGFTEVSFYEDRSPEPYVYSGNWKMKGDTLIIYKPDDDLRKQFLADHPELRLLDQSGQRITGELEDQYLISENPEWQSIRNHHQRLAETGILITASGNEPFWNMQIKQDNTITYREPGEPEQNFQAERTDQNGITRWTADQLSVTLTAGYCRDTMSGFLFSHYAEAEIHQHTFKGCGTFLE